MLGKVASWDEGPASLHPSGNKHYARYFLGRKTLKKPRCEVKAATPQTRGSKTRKNTAHPDLSLHPRPFYHNPKNIRESQHSPHQKKGRLNHQPGFFAYSGHCPGSTHLEPGHRNRPTEFLAVRIFGFRCLFVSEGLRALGFEGLLAFAASWVCKPRLKFGVLGRQPGGVLV